MSLPKDEETEEKANRNFSILHVVIFTIFKL
jgi:hypothetical protein